jgi:hypothetical protein
MRDKGLKKEVVLLFQYNILIKCLAKNKYFGIHKTS